MSTLPPFIKNTLANAVEKRENNLNAIRLLLALLVLYCHCYGLSLGSAIGYGFGMDGHNRANFQYDMGYIAVDLFFFLSGLLITASWLRSKSMNDYLRKRVLRIYPGFLVALLFSTIIMTAANPADLLRKVVSWPGLKSFLNNSFWLSITSLSGPDVFAHNPFPHYANGSMWTIVREFECYLGICVIGLFGWLRFRWAVLALFIYTYLYLFKAVLGGDNLAEMDRRFLTYFLAGTCTWLWRDKIPLKGSIALACLVFLSLLVFISGPWLIVEPFALTYIILWLGYAKPLKATRWCDSTDLSYGVYLYAFPLQQLIATTAWGRRPLIMLSLALPITIVLALLSWHLIEKPFLNLKSFSFSDKDPAISPIDTQLNEAF